MTLDKENRRGIFLQSGGVDSYRKGRVFDTGDGNKEGNHLQKGAFVSTKKTGWGILLLSFALSVFLPGCAGDPSKELEQVRDAVDQARQDEVDKYAPDLFSQVEQTVDHAEDLIAQKKFGQARETLKEAKALIDSASSEAQTNMDNMGLEVEDLLSTADQAWQGLLQTREAAKKWNIPTDKWELKEEMARWDQQLKHARSDYEQEDYYSAKQEVGKVLDELTAADSQIKDLIEAKQ
jgi:hypothetical protein